MPTIDETAMSAECSKASKRIAIVCISELF